MPINAIQCPFSYYVPAKNKVFVILFSTRMTILLDLCCGNVVYMGPGMLLYNNNFIV